MEKVLLHTCCAPCATASIERLIDKYCLIAYFYNPNIHPEKEYNIRKNEIIKLTDYYNIELIIGDYDKDNWFRTVKGFEKEPENGKRCELCFLLRLENTARKAAELGINKFTSTLSISPHKNFEKIKKISEKIAVNYNMEFLPENFKKKDGFKRSIELSKRFKLYRQTYCGCCFSRNGKES